MAKKKAAKSAVKKSKKKVEPMVVIEDECGFYGCMDHTEHDEEVAMMMETMIDASNRQMEIAVALTKIVSKASTKPMTEEEVFATFKRAVVMVGENLPLNGMCERFWETQ